MTLQQWNQRQARVLSLCHRIRGVEPTPESWVALAIRYAARHAATRAQIGG